MTSQNTFTHSGGEANRAAVGVMSRFPPGLLTLMILLGFWGCFIPVVTKRTRESNVVKMKKKKKTPNAAHTTLSPR